MARQPVKLMRAEERAANFSRFNVCPPFGTYFTGDHSLTYREQARRNNVKTELRQKSSFTRLGNASYSCRLSAHTEIPSNIRLFQDRDNILMVMKDSAYHKGPLPRQNGQSRVAAE
jgi:hypothetical protein